MPEKMTQPSRNKHPTTCSQHIIEWLQLEPARHDFSALLTYITGRMQFKPTKQNPFTGI
jgi:hypothetical protein